jgi:thioredoxin 2
LDVILACPSCSQLNRLPAARLRERARCSACKGSILPLSTPLAIKSAQEFEELVGNALLPVLVDFWAAWCGPCRSVAPELEKMARERAGDLIVAKVDTEALPDVASRFAIRSIPTMILMRAGRESKRIMGAMPASSIAAQLAI